MKSERLREMTREELTHQIRELEDELFNIRVRRALQPPDNPVRLRLLRRQLARVRTILREGELGITPGASKKTAV
ncbi:MAG: 50S ribosomal protein L29 [candidate division Zixibacteria bacterium]|nr:50S ribosomal protein L29 [candidate division Zixibacteria bacterium]